jgi:hypothetical protein
MLPFLVAWRVDWISVSLIALLNSIWKKDYFILGDKLELKDLLELKDFLF